MAYLHWQYRMAHKPVEDMANFHTKVDRLAMLICEEQGLDPWEHVTIPEATEEMTPFESRGRSYHEPPPLPVPLPVVMLPHGELSAGRPCEVTQPYTSSQAPRVFTTTLPRWRTFRRQAALQIAGYKAMTKYLLTEA